MTGSLCCTAKFITTITFIIINYNKKNFNNKHYLCPPPHTHTSAHTTSLHSHTLPYTEWVKLELRESFSGLGVEADEFMINAALKLYDIQAVFTI